MWRNSGTEFIKGWAQGKLTVCEHEFARLFLTQALGFQHNCTCYEDVYPYAWVLSPDVFLLQILMNPLTTFQFYAEKSPEDAEDAEVGELCGSTPPHRVRCSA